MGKGRRRTATAVAEANGTLRRNKYRRDDSNVPPQDNCTPDMPDYFDEFAREKWDELVYDLRNMKVISSECREIMIAYCEAYSGWRRCLQLVRQLGPAIVIRQERGGEVKIKRNPLSAELHKYRDQMNRLLPEFGLTPSSRTKLVAFKDQGDSDPFVELVARLSGDN